MPVDSNLDKHRVMQAMRRGWVRQEQVEECLLELNTADSILGELQRRGWLNQEQVSELCGAGGARVTMPENEVPTPPAGGPGSGNLDADNLDETLAQGDLIADRYLIQRMCKGGFGRVYLCTDMVSGQRAALKTMLREHLASGRLLEMFRQEILLWIQLGVHPNIVLAYGLEEFMRLPFVVMEWVDGGSLEDLVDHGGMTWQQAANFGWQIANGLEHAGRVCGLVHRDLKPANVMLTSEGVAKVTDFGISLVRGAHGGQSLGTPEYMSPEQWHGVKLDVRSDVYSFGVTLYELACGRLPFASRIEDSTDELKASHLTRTPPDPRQLNPQIPEALAQVILQCMEKRPERRPADFAAIRRTLEPLAGPRPTSLSAAPDLVGGLVNQSKTFGLLGRTEEALHTAQEAVRLAPRDANARVALGNALARRGKFGEAFGHMQAAHRLDPDNPMAIVNSALYANLAGDRDEAETWLDLAIASVDSRHLEGAASLLIDFGRVPEAIALCRSIVENNPLAVAAWNHLAIALRRNGDLEEALVCATRTIQINPRYAKGWSNRANVLLQLQRFDEALASAERALQFDEKTAGAYAAKAAALGASDRMDEGRECLLKGLEVLPGNPLLLRAMERF
jgi:tetratricopeptide (TPR) repeat protein